MDFKFVKGEQGGERERERFVSIYRPVDHGYIDYIDRSINQSIQNKQIEK